MQSSWGRLGGGRALLFSLPLSLPPSLPPSLHDPPRSCSPGRAPRWRRRTTPWIRCSTPCPNSWTRCCCKGGVWQGVGGPLVALERMAAVRAYLVSFDCAAIVRLRLNGRLRHQVPSAGGLGFLWVLALFREIKVWIIGKKRKEGWKDGRSSPPPPRHTPPSLSRSEIFSVFFP